MHYLKREELPNLHNWDADSTHHLALFTCVHARNIPCGRQYLVVRNMLMQTMFLTNTAGC